MSSGKKAERPKLACWDLAAPALGFAGGVVGSLAVLSYFHLPKGMKDHALLSGPFLSFVALIVLLVIFHRPLHEMLTRGNLTFSWGDKKISIQDIEENFDQEIEARLDSLATEIQDLRKRISPVSGGAEEKPDDNASFQSSVLDRISKSFSIDSELALIIYHLGTSKYKWRNQHTLTNRTDLPANKIEELARHAPQFIVQGRGKSGNTIFRLTDSAKREFGSVIALGA